MYFCGCIYALRECGPTPVSSFTPTPHLATTESTWRLQLRWFLWCHCVDSRCCHKANCSLWTEKHGRTLFVHNFMLSMKSSNYRPLSLAVLHRPTSYPADLRWHYSSSITCSNFSAGLELHFISHIRNVGLSRTNVLRQCYYMKSCDVGLLTQTFSVYWVWIQKIFHIRLIHPTWIVRNSYPLHSCPSSALTNNVLLS